MVERKQRRHPDHRMLSAPTGDDFYEPDEQSVVSDAEIEAGSATSIGSQIGRTPSDLLHESGFSKSLSTFIKELDPIELMFVVAYVVLSGWGNSAHPVWPFAYFGIAILVYHVLGRPTAAGLLSWARTLAKQANHTDKNR